MSKTMQRARRLLAAPLLLMILAGMYGCGGNTKDRSCDEPERYQAAVETDKVQVPEDLDNLDEFKQLPLPEASPRPPRAKGSPCLDLPPSILSDGQ